MESIGVSVSRSNSSADSAIYIFQSTVQMFETISDKIVLSLYCIVLLVSVIQTFCQNKYIDHFLSSMMESYSDGKIVRSQIYFHKRLITCYRYDQRYSYIPNPNRIILLIIVTHVQVILVIIMRTLFDRRTEFINDCLSFDDPYRILQCEDKIDPCQFNNTIDESLPKCPYYYFQMNHFITMVTSITTWHYALRYFIVKLIRIVRWLSFSNDDQPRKICWCCCRSTPFFLRLIMCFQYAFLWLYLFATIICGFVLNIMIFRLSMDTSGSIWALIIITADRICSLSFAVGPELFQNWLNATVDGKVLQVIEQQNLLLTKVEPLISLTEEKQDLSTSSKNQCRNCCC